jgi:hypothetical protein
MTMAKIRVRCAYEIEVEVPDDWTAEDVRFHVEENGCPGTGLVGAALEAHRDRCEAASVCWACALQGTNEVMP